MKRLTALALPLTLVGCDAVQLAPTTLNRVRGQLQHAFAPVPAPAIVAGWTTETGDMACGEIAAPASLRDQQSTVRFVGFGETFELEPHLVADDARGQQVAVESAAIFDRLWTQSCAPAAPLERRVAGWFRWPRGGQDPDTPLTNAYAGEVLRRNRQQ